MQKYSELLEYDEDFVQKLRRFNRFQILYAPYWIDAPDAANAQLNDLQFVRNMAAFRRIDKELVDAVMSTWHGHEDFLIPEFSFLSLVGSKVGDEERRRIAENILKTTPPAFFPIQASKPAVKITPTTQLHHLAQGSRVHLPFALLGVSTDFLRKDPDEWATDKQFERLKMFVDNFRVVNDCSERAVQMATDFNGKLTHDEVQRSYLFQNIVQQRRERSDLTRKALQP